MWSCTLSRPVSGRSRFLTSVALPVTLGLFAATVPQAVRAQQVIDGPPPVVKSVNEVIAGGLVIGDTLPASELTIDSAAVIESQGLTLIGSQAGSAGLLTVQDGAALNINNEFYVGFLGDGELLISSGGQVTNTGAGIGAIGASNSTATVTGAGSTWTSTGTLSVGFQGQGTLFVEDGGTLISTNGYVGQLDTSTSSATITGAGSSWAASASLFVGFSGHGSLTIADGALVTSVTDSWIGFGADATGLVTVSGAGSTWTNSAFLITGYQNEGELRIEDGGTVTNTTGYLGMQPAGTGVATVTGADSIWTNVDTLFVGQGGQGTLTVADGGTVAVSGVLGALEVGYLVGSVGVVNVGAAAGSAAVGAGDIDAAFVRFGQGSGSLVFNHSDTGYEFDAAIVGAGTVSHYSGETILTSASNGWAGETNIHGGALVVEGTTSNAGQDIYVGRLVDDDGFLAIQNGGALSSGRGFIGADAGSFGEAQVIGVGSSWSMTDAFVVGDGGDGVLTVADSGQIEAGDAAIGVEVDATGGVLVTGVGSTWDSTSLVVGVFGQGLLAIEDGAVVTTGAAAIGLEADSIGQVYLTGAGTTWNAGPMVTLGDEGTGLMVLANGATLSLDGGAGTLLLAADNTSFGGLLIAEDCGCGAEGPGVLDAAQLIFGAGDGSILFAHEATDYVFGANISGFGQIALFEGGTIFTGDSSGFTGFTLVGAALDVASLTVSGILGGDVGVAEDGTLTGGGSILGHVDVELGALVNAAGTTLTMGSLDLEAGSLVQVTLGAAGSPALFDVLGDLVLDGELTVTDAGGFGPGVYRLFDYGGILTDNGLDIADLPAGQDLTDWAVQVSVANQINLVGAIGPGDLLFWDGADGGLHDNSAVNGGDGVWDAVNVNWTEMTGAVNGAMTPQPGFAIFSGVAGDVTVDANAGAVAVTGIQFAVDGYQVSGDSIGLTEAETVVRVGDGTADGADMTATIASDLTGAGGLVKTDLGALVLTGTNSYEGGTFVEGGILIGDVDSLIGDIDNQAGVVFNQGVAGIYDGVWSGDGRFEVEGAGLSLTGDSSGFSGGTFVHDGLLFVEGELGGMLALGSFGRLEGSGSVGTLTVGSGGVVAPGDAIATLTVNGDVTFEPGSLYEVQTDPVSGASDLVHATGAAQINGGTVAHVGVDGDYEAFSTYTILTADGGVDGTFDDLTTDFAFLDPELTYDANNVYLTLVRNDVSFGGVSRSKNQAATGAAVERLDFGNPIWNAVVMLDADGARAAFDGLSGEIHASARSGLIGDSGRLRQLLGGRLHRDPTAAGLDLWGEAYGMTGRTDGDGNAASLEYDGRGLFFEFDRLIGPWRLGLVAGASRADFEVAGRASTADTDSRHAGVYGEGSHGSARLRFGALRSWHEIMTDRAVVVGAIVDAPEAQYDAESSQTFAEIGWRFAPGFAEAELFAGVAHVEMETDPFVETGGAAVLVSQGGEDSVTFTTLGLRLARLSREGVTLHGSAAWLHAEEDVRPESQVSLGGAANPFGVFGAPVGADVLALEVGLDAPISSDLTVGFAYSGQLGDGVGDHILRGSVTLRF